MDIALWIQSVSSVALLIVAVAMLCNARATKKLEETNQKIAIWPEIKEIIVAIEEYTSNVNEVNKLDTFPDLFTNINVVQYAPYFSREGRDLLPHLKDLGTIGKKLQLSFRSWSLPIKNGSDDEKEKREAEIKRMSKSLEKESNKIKEILRNLNNLGKPIRESWIKRLFCRREN